MEFTPNQQLAIDVRDKNILVSAAAGSGKTAVLVNRIIKRVLDDNNPVDIDRILVMTFTNAAATQMRERILDAIEEKRKDKPFDKNLQKQAALVHSANISTIDSFCLNVVRGHYSEIDMNPDFRIADEGELKLLKRDVIADVLEKSYQEAFEDFLIMTESFALKKDDSQIEDIILNLHNFAESYPDPEQWLDMCTDSYLNADPSEINNAVWLVEYVDGVRALLNNHRQLLDRAGDACLEEYGPSVYEAAINDDIDFVDRLLSAEDYSGLYSIISEIGKPSFTKLATLRLPKEGEAPIEEIELRTQKKENVTSIRNKYKSYINSLFEEILNNSPESIARDLNMMAPAVKALINTTKRFRSEYNEKKNQKNLVDFNDLEHMCLKILQVSESAASEYKELFKEIYVDEYQDSNLVQEEIVKLLCLDSENEGNLFMVGDVKQSIYGFRLARPELFVDKYNRFPDYSQDAKADVKIDLHDNFRSRTDVIESINDVFSSIMTAETGDIIYDDKAALHAKAEYPDGDHYETEMLCVYHDDEINDRQLEALAVANRIKELMSTMKVTEEKELRPLRYSDIVILLRSAKDWDSVFQATLEGEGIPVHVTASTGYFSKEEVTTLLDYLKIIDNPRQDIPLMTVLRSCIGNMFDEEIALVRAAFPDGCLYESLISYSETAEDAREDSRKNTCEKINSFLNEVNYYRKKTGYTSVDMIITEIIDGYYGECVLAKKNGKKKFANLQMLLERAKAYGKTSYKGIFHFNRYIEMLHKYEVDFGEASILDEKDDAVRIMTIHKSKGLEFPVCFVSGMSKKMNTMDEKSIVVTDADRGIGVDVVDIARRTRKKSLYKRALSRKKHLDSLSEELRVFYVAMTRAKEKLILTGLVKEEGDLDDNNVILLNAASYLDFYKYVSTNKKLDSINRKDIFAHDIISSKIKETVSREAIKEELLKTISIDMKELPEDILSNVNFLYPYKDDKSGIKVSVSELKRRHMMAELIEDNEDAEPVTEMYTELEKKTPRFISPEEKSFSPALRGTAIHRMFEIWDYNQDSSLESVSSYIEGMHQRKRLDDELYPLADKGIMYQFLKSSIATRMKEADKEGLLYREQPFVIEDKETGMLIQGIIDAYFIEDNEIVVVDYKTDKASNSDYLVNKYKIQLDYYATALAMLTGKNVKEKVIYSTCLDKAISM